MIRAFLFFLVIFGIFAALIFLWKHLGKVDIKITGKLLIACVLSAVVTVLIYMAEMQ